MLEILSDKPVWVGVSHGWLPAGDLFRVTDVKNSLLTSLNAIPAVQVFSDYARQTNQNFDLENPIPIASHELKTPVTSINGFIQVLQKLYPAEKNEQTNYILTRTKVQVDRLIRLIGDILDVTKIKIGKLALNVEDADMNNVIDELIEEHLTTITSHKIIHQGSINTKIRCDKSRIEQVMSNLLTNAVKYSQKADKIIVTTREDNDHAYVDVQDFGIGIAPESVPKRFTRFYRAHGEDAGMLSSLGLGLFISADIIKRHNGEIWVDSELGKGSTFHFSLPKN